MMHNIRQYLAFNLKQMRKSRAESIGKTWSIAQLAQRAGVSPGAIQKIESQACWPDWKTLEKLALALGCEVDQLFLGRAEKLTLPEIIAFINSNMPHEFPFLVVAKAKKTPLAKPESIEFNSELFESRVAPLVEKAETIVSEARRQKKQSP